jgi:SAM-dependent methyltransferase
MWIGKNEFRSFSDCLFHNRKQSRHPWISERAIEYPWVYKNIADLKNRRVLDVGAKEGLPTTDLLLENQNIVYTIDINASSSREKGNLIAVKGDIISTSFEDGFFDAVIVVSTLEHIGVAGRYGISDSNELGDFQAMQEIFRVLKPEGRVLVTVPYGLGRSLPLNRLYDISRIEKLFKDFEIITCQYFRFEPKYKMWFEVPEALAASNDWDHEPWYALACFCAKKSNDQ